MQIRFSSYKIDAFPCGLVARIRRSHRRGRGSIPRKGEYFLLRPVKRQLYLPISI